MENYSDIAKVVELNSLKNDLTQFIDFFPTGIFLLDKDFVITSVNKLTLALLSAEKENLIGKNIFDFVSSGTSVQFENLLRKSFSDFHQTLVIEMLKQDNSLIDLLAAVKCFKATDINEKFYILTIIDHTSQKMAQEIIKQSESRFKDLANTAPVMIWIADVEGLFSFVNKIWLDYTGGKVGNQIGMNWIRNVHPEDIQLLLNNYQKAIGDQQAFTFEFRLMGKDKKYEWMLFKGKPRFSSDNIFLGFIGSCFSINEQKEIEATIFKMNEKLVESNATKDKFFSIISHDLRSPLGGLMGVLDILNESYESLSEREKKELISDAALSSKTTYTLVENLLEWSKIQTGKINSNPERLKLLQLVNNIASIYEQNVKSKGIPLNINVKPEQYVFGDKAMIETVLRNLVSNAIKFSFTNNSITISSETARDYVLITVEDTGAGIEEEDIPKLFRSDINFSSRGTAKESGTGLGLIICKELVEKQNGKIWVKSKKDEGSSFYFTIPVAK